MALNLTVAGRVPADHFEAAEALLAVAQHEPQPEIRDRMLSAAQVHAILALAERFAAPLSHERGNQIRRAVGLADQPNTDLPA